MFACGFVMVLSGFTAISVVLSHYWRVAFWYDAFGVGLSEFYSFWWLLVPLELDGFNLFLASKLASISFLNEVANLQPISRLPWT